jgi:hypothetical protein
MKKNWVSNGTREEVVSSELHDGEYFSRFQQLFSLRFAQFDMHKQDRH